MIKTQYGCVGLRRNRDKLQIKLHGARADAPKAICRGWLATEAKRSLDEYRLGVKQAMLIAATNIELEDLATTPMHVGVLPTGGHRTPQAIRERQAKLRLTEQSMLDGTAPVPLKRLTKDHAVVRQGKKLDKHVLIKRSAKFNLNKQRFFNIDSGRLNVFRHDRPNLKPNHVFDLADVQCRYENTRTPAVAEPFVDGYGDRVVVQCPERPHGPMYLYAKDGQQAKSWERAINMSKYLLNPSDREALAVVVGRVTCNVGKKGWDALFRYMEEIKETRKLVKNLAMRLKQVELSKGWNKMRLVFQEKASTDKLRAEQKEWAARFLKEKMDRINVDTARPPHVVRHTIISQVQSKFRHFREEKIFDRAYPLGSTVRTRMQQAFSGFDLGCCFRSLKYDDVIALTLKGEAMQLLNTSPEVFQGRKSTYSEVNVALCRSHVGLSDSLTMLSFSPLSKRDEDASDANLAKEHMLTWHPGGPLVTWQAEAAEAAEAAWASFVNTDQISSVVLHSERIMGGESGHQELRPSLCTGAWMTINGPRVSWCRSMRRIRDAESHRMMRHAVGADDGMALAKQLAKGEKVHWFRINVQVKGAAVPRDSDGGNRGFTYLLLHVLGRQFRTERQPNKDGRPQFHGRFEAEVAISSEPQALSALDEDEISFEFVDWHEEPSLCRTSWAGSIKLWKALVPEGDSECFVTLADSISGGRGQGFSRVKLVHAGGLRAGEELNKKAFVDLEVTAKIVESSEPARKCLSPELLGLGQITTLFSTHRGAWYDPKMGRAKFIVDHVANFVELKLDTLTFPQDDTPDPNKVYRYHIEASCNGVTVTSIALHRPKPAWTAVVPSDPGIIAYAGSKLFLALPPGAWSLPQRPVVEICVRRCFEVDAPTRNFQEFVAANGKPGPDVPSFEKVYHGQVVVDGLLVDQSRPKLDVILSKTSQPAVINSLDARIETPSFEPAILSVSLTLRDRDYVRLNMASPEDSGPPATILCVGDKVMLRVEEPVNYPISEDEFRYRMFPGTWDRTQTGRGRFWAAPLRDPCLSHEFAASGLDRIANQASFKQRHIPGTYDDIVPCRFILPSTEKQFIEEARPGSFWRIVDGILAQGKSTEPNSHTSTDPVIVTHMTHLFKNVPCTVLAVYANGTCDLEVLPTFLHDWESKAHRYYAIPGSVVLRDFQDNSAAFMRSAAMGTGDVGQRMRRRVMLKEVPIGSVLAVQASAFNIYDAALGNTDDAIGVHPGSSRNDFNPRELDDEYLSSADAKRKGGYAMSAGPVPADVGASCQYEWQLHLHAPSEDEMYHFITTLRQSVRMDLAQQVQKMHEFRAKSAARADANIDYHTGPTLTTASGNLEVVLVEARHLKPAKVQKFKDLKHMLQKATEVELTPFVRFQLMTSVEVKGNTTKLIRPRSATTLEVASTSGFQVGGMVLIGEVAAEARERARIASIDGGVITVDKPLRTKHQIGAIITAISRKDEVLVCRGSKSQTAPAMQSTSNPDWSQLDELRSSGGWSFKSSTIEPNEMTELFFELEVLHRGIGGVEYSIGSVRVPVTGGPGDDVVPPTNLCSTQDPFHNIWLPLYQTSTDNKRVLNPSGELHVLTLWVPKQPNGTVSRQPKTARAFLVNQLRPNLLASHVREPVYDIPLRKHGYNPNITKDGFPQTRADYMAYHTEKALTSTPYLECCERQREEQWSKFFAAQAAEGSVEGDEHRPRGVWPRDFHRRGGRVCNLRNDCFAAGDFDKVYEIEDLLRRGVPAKWRRQIWMDITNASTVLAQKAFKPDDPSACYVELVKEGRPFRSDAMLQLHEDVVGAAAWETSQNAKVLDKHLHRLKRAQDVCIALVTFSKNKTPQTRFHFTQDESDGPEGSDPVGIAYCESLFLLAYMLLLPQTRQSGRAEGMQDKDEWSRVFSVLQHKGAIPKARLAQAIENLSGTKASSDLVEEVFADVIASINAPTHAMSLSDVDFMRFVSRYFGREQHMRFELEEEAGVFWLLYTLIGSPTNQAFREYFGTPPGYPCTYALSEQRKNPINERSGAMEDVFRLEKCVARWESEIWVHLNCLGFHLSTVFYGAFMRLFATYLPTAAVFRFWDFIFSASKYPYSADKPKRHALIDLAFGTIRACKATLLKCESAAEARDCLVSYLESQYDPSAVIHLTVDAEIYLWEGQLQDKTGFALHTTDYTKALRYYDIYLEPFRAQNEVLKDLVREIQLNLEIFQRGKNVTMAGDRRITCRNVVTFIIPTLMSLLNEKTDKPKFGGCFRPTTREIVADGPELDQSVMGTLRSLVWGSVEKVIVAGLSRPLAISIPPPPGTVGEPTETTKQQFLSQVTKGLGQEFNNMNIVVRLYEAFQCMPEKERVSLNEMFLALVCCSKGTLGDKAIGLFNLYSCNLDAPRMFHQKPPTHHTATVVEKVEGNQERAQATLYRPPVGNEVKKVALHFKVYTYASQFAATAKTSSDDEGVLLGEVFVPTLRPFLFSGFGKDTPQKFTIWGTSTMLPPNYQSWGAASAPTPQGEVRPYIGEVIMSIKWVPQNQGAASARNTGQIGIHLYAVYFSPDRVSSVSSKNPKVTVCTYDEEGNEVKIPGWDPRNMLRRAVSAATLGVKYGGAFGDIIEFHETMRRDTFGMLHHKIGTGDQGWDSRSRMWRWGSKWGDQYSVEGFTFRTEVCDFVKGALSISMQACRIITQAILQRSLAIVTNRQAYLIADQTFNRAGAAPAILDAILVSGRINSKYTTTRELREDEAARGTWQDVKQQIAQAYESQVSTNLGNMNLWPRNSETGEQLQQVNLRDLNIRDSPVGTAKVLWIRYARAGDGERGQKQIPVDQNGYLVAPFEVPLDLDLHSKVGMQQMLIKKEEFVSSLLRSPVLSESLRQLSTSDGSFRNVPVGAPIKLNVAIADPTKEEQDADFFDAFHGRQAILIEIWDFDRASKDDFLGECWLPPLGNLGPQPRQFVIPVGGPGGHDGVTRPDKKKNATKAVCTGDLIVEASWTFPADGTKPSGRSVKLEDRVKEEEMLHTGKLYLKIIKAQGLRYADVRRSRGSDPYCICYVRNEAVAQDRAFVGANDDPNERGWRVSELTGLHDPIFRTSWKKSTVNPEWNESLTLNLMTGSFEKRTKMALSPAFTGRQAQRRRDEHALKVLADREEVQLFFGDDDQKNKEGARHNVQVFLGETIHQFKTKLMLACQQEADAFQKAILQARARNESQDKLAEMEEIKIQYQSVANSVTSKHVVMVFVPSQQLRKLAPMGTAAHEYKRLYKVEEQDPSSWQPLDPTRTFLHYAMAHGFGYPTAQRLRICEGTADYKLRNHRYRQFEQEQRAWGRHIADLNKDDVCFGYSMYSHANDGNSTEWRPALLSRTSRTRAEGGARIYRAQYVYAVPPRLLEDTDQNKTSASTKEDVDEDHVLLAPTVPNILGSNNLQHKGLLRKAPAMADDGASHIDIAKQLNEELQLKYGGLAGDAQVQAPPPITPQEVQHYLRTVTSCAVPFGGVTTAAAQPVDVAPAPTDEASPAEAPTVAPKAPPGGGVGLIGPVGQTDSSGLDDPSRKAPSLATGKAGPSMGKAGPAKGKAGPSMGKAGPSMGKGGPSMGPGSTGKGGPGGVSVGPSMGPMS